jgi:integrase
VTRKKKSTKAGNGRGSVKWYPSMRRIVGQVRRNGKIIARKYGKPGENSRAAEMVVWAKLQPYLTLDAETDASLTVKAALDLYAARPKLAPSTRDRYKKVINYFDRLGAKRVIDVKPSDIRRTIDAIESERGAKMDRTRQIAYKLLRAVFEDALDDGLIARNPVKAVDTPEYRREEKTRVFTPVEQGFIRKANAELGGANEALLLLALSMPVRPCELYALRRCDLSLSARKVRIENDLIATAESNHNPILGPVKTPESRREIFPTDEVAAAIRRLLEAQMATGRTTPESFIFTSPGGAPIRHSNLARNWWKPLLEKAAELAEKASRDAGDFDYRFPKHSGPYSLRHTSIENLKAAGVPMDVVHTLAGHSNVQTTMAHYNQPTEARKLEAAAVVGKWFAEKAVAG